MSFEFIKKLPTPEEIREQYALPANLVALKEERDAEIQKVITGESDKFLVIIGPCSADREDAVLEYITRLKKVQEIVEEKLILVPRILAKRIQEQYPSYCILSVIWSVFLTTQETLCSQVKNSAQRSLLSQKKQKLRFHFFQMQLLRLLTFHSAHLSTTIFLLQSRLKASKKLSTV